MTECIKCSLNSLQCRCYERCNCGKHPSSHADDFIMRIDETGMNGRVIKQKIYATCKVCKDEFNFISTVTFKDNK